MITLFDIPFSTPDSSWSPNTLKTRLSLDLKGIPFTTQWVEYPDIVPLSQRLGIVPTITRDDGSVVYTLPAIVDEGDDKLNVGQSKAMAESWAIASYLDSTYPGSGVTLVPVDAEKMRKVEDFVMGGGETNIREILRPLYQVMRFVILPQLNERSRDHFSRARAREMRSAYPHAQKLEDVLPSSEERKEMWVRALEAFEKLGDVLGATDAEGPWFLGDEVSFADCAIGAVLVWVRNVCGELSEEWKGVLQTGVRGGEQGEGRWERYLGALKALGMACV